MSKREFGVRGASPKERTYHYVQCGLDNVYLRNGYEVETFNGEEYVRVRNVQGLWKAIGISLVTKQRELSPAEIRFLRRHMELSQEELGRKLRVDAQTIARWEKEQTKIQGPADFAIRTLFLTSPVAQPEGGELIAMLYDFADKAKKEEPSRDTSAIEMMETHDSWQARLTDRKQMKLFASR